MTIALTLDKEALASLFPAGSEVRLHLANAVISNIAKRAIVKVEKESIRQIEIIAESRFRELMMQNSNGPYSSSRELSNSFRKLIKTEAESSFNEQVKGEILPDINRHIAHIDNLIVTTEKRINRKTEQLLAKLESKASALNTLLD